MTPHVKILEIVPTCDEKNTGAVGSSSVSKDGQTNCVRWRFDLQQDVNGNSQAFTERSISECWRD